MDSFYATVGVVAFLVLILLIAPPRHLYQCQKCGFETYSEAEAHGHEKLENAHKMM